MSPGSPSNARKTYRYVELNDQADDHPRDSVDSNVPVLQDDEERSGENASIKSANRSASELAAFRRPIEGYEGAHRYDPEFTWNQQDEQEVVWKVCAFSCTNDAC